MRRMPRQQLLKYRPMDPHLAYQLYAIVLVLLYGIIPKDAIIKEPCKPIISISMELHPMICMITVRQVTL